MNDGYGGFVLSCFEFDLFSLMSCLFVCVELWVWLLVWCLFGVLFWVFVLIDGFMLWVL